MIILLLKKTHNISNLYYISCKEYIYKIYKSNLETGFTLIELIIVISIMAILTVAGIISFVDYGRSQSVSAVALSMESILQLSRSRALSQLIDSCKKNGITLDGYEFKIKKIKDIYSYEINEGCSNGDTNILETIYLPPEIKITSPSELPATFFFPVFSGGVNPGGITICGYNKVKTIYIYEFGKIKISTTSAGKC